MKIQKPVKRATESTESSNPKGGIDSYAKENALPYGRATAPSAVRFADSIIKNAVVIPAMNRWAIFGRPLRGLKTPVIHKKQTKVFS